jgi:DNA-binding transcriptional regulator GbsR (MarR family)
VQIYDILSQYGPQTASSLAEKLGESSGSTSYHLRALAKHDLIQECTDRGTGRERWWERPIGGVSFANAEAMKTPAGRAATQIVMNEFFRNRQEQLMRFMEDGISDLDEKWQTGTLISTASTRLTPEQTKELSLKIMALIDDAVDRYRNQTGEDVRPVTIRADLFPLPDMGGQS